MPMAARCDIVLPTAFDLLVGMARAPVAFPAFRAAVRRQTCPVSSPWPGRSLFRLMMHILVSDEPRPVPDRCPTC